MSFMFLHSALIRSPNISSGRHILHGRNSDSRHNSRSIKHNAAIANRGVLLTAPAWNDRRDGGTGWRYDIPGDGVHHLCQSSNTDLCQRAALQGSGPPFAATLAATCLVASVSTIAMGLFSNYPFALAPGLGSQRGGIVHPHRRVEPTLAGRHGRHLYGGALITILVLTGFREAVMHAIPNSLNKGISVGIGLFILFIGLEIGELIVWGSRDIWYSRRDCADGLTAAIGHSRRLRLDARLFARGTLGALL